MNLQQELIKTGLSSKFAKKRDSLLYDDFIGLSRFPEIPSSLCSMGNPIIDYLTASSPILSLCPNELLQVKLDFHLKLNTLISLAQIPGTAYSDNHRF
jgi:hypothetical protein